jgi:hypothetical protein
LVLPEKSLQMLLQGGAGLAFSKVIGGCMGDQVACGLIKTAGDGLG